jgi:hypothetical protein
LRDSKNLNRIEDLVAFTARQLSLLPTPKLEAGVDHGAKGIVSDAKGGEPVASRGAITRLGVAVSGEPCVCNAGGMSGTGFASHQRMSLQGTEAPPEIGICTDSGFAARSCARIREGAGDLLATV